MEEKEKFEFPPSQEIDKKATFPQSRNNPNKKIKPTLANPNPKDNNFKPVQEEGKKGRKHINSVPS